MDAEAQYADIADDLAARHDDVELGQMMGMPAIKRGGKMVGGFSRSEDAMVFKLTNEEHRESALTLEGAHLFDPSGGRRAAMKEWVVVPAAHARQWRKLADQAVKPRAG